MLTKLGGFALVLVAALSVASAQDQNGPVRNPFVVFGSRSGEAPVIVTGSYRLLGQSASRQGSFQEKPPDLWRAELNPSLLFYGIPLTASVLVSSEQRDVRQNINAFSLTLDPDAVRRIVTQRAYAALNDYARTEAGQLLDSYDEVRDSLQRVDPERLKELEEYRKLQQMRDVAKGDISDYTDVLSSMGFMSDVERVMASLPTVGVGTVFPTFTPITLSGARIQGAMLEWNPGWFYVHVTGGTMQRPLLRFDSVRVDSGLFTSADNSAYGRHLYAARLGVGRRDGSHVFLTGMFVEDDPVSVALTDSNTALTPQKNMLTGLDLRVEPIEGVWSMQAEAAVSLTVADRTAPTLSDDDVPGFLLGLSDSSASSYFDWAATAQTAVNIRETGTRFTASIRRIGPGYRALAVPNLRTDILRYDVRADQSFWKRQMSVGLFYRRDLDNLIPWKRSTTTITSLGGTLGLNIRRWPFLRVSYAPYAQINDATDTLLRFDNRTTVLNVTTGYNYRIGSMGAGTTLTYGQQNSSTLRGASDYGVTSVNVQQSLSFVFPLSVTAGLGYIVQSAAGQPDNGIVTVDIGGSYSVFDELSCNAGLMLALDDTYGARSGYHIGVTAALGEYANIDIRAERNIFDERVVPAVYGGTYRETIFRATISQSW
ncbi:MAG TPA: hypothetical protein DIS79_08260 [Bacteroidetes bacterium]|nr:hypothetical protein [Bacteroidota bacterium]